MDRKQRCARLTERIIYGCGNEVPVTKFTTRVPRGKVLSLPWNAAGAYRDVEDEGAGAVLRHTKERKVLKLKLQERKVSELWARGRTACPCCAAGVAKGSSGFLDLVFFHGSPGPQSLGYRHP